MGQLGTLRASLTRTSAKYTEKNVFIVNDIIILSNIESIKAMYISIYVQHWKLWIVNAVNRL